MTEEVAHFGGNMEEIGTSYIAPVKEKVEKIKTIVFSI